MSAGDPLDEAIRLHQAGDLVNAGKIYRQVLAKDANNADARHLLGVIARQRGDNVEAARLIASAIAAAPNVAVYHSNLGRLLHQQQRFDEAAQAFQRAIECQSNDALTWADLSQTLRALHRFDEALAAARKAVALQPDPAITRAYLAHTLMDDRNVEQAIAEYRAAAQIDPARFRSNLLYALHFSDEVSPQQLRDEHLAWAPRPCRTETRVTRLRHDLRIGYLSPDFRNHVVARFLEPILRAHKLEVTCYSNSATEDETTARLQALTKNWRDVHAMPDDELAAQIRKDEIDILVDLTLHATGNRIGALALKPAPVQVSYLGYPGTTGLAAMDFRLTDSLLDPPGNDAYYSEKSIRLPKSYWCYAPPPQAPNVSELPAKTNRFITFGGLNQSFKVSPRALATYAKILSRVTDSRIVLFALTTTACDRIKKTFAAENISADRIEFVGWQPIDQYLAMHNRIDIALDSFPYAGGTTTLDALWMGAPAVTLAGKVAVQRAGVSILDNVGLPNLIAQTTEEFANIAVALANDLPRLAGLRASMRARMSASPLMDIENFIRDLENAFKKMWDECKSTIYSSAADEHRVD